MTPLPQRGRALISCDHRAPWLSDLPPQWAAAPLKHVSWINRRSLPEHTPPERQIRYIDIGAVDSLGRIEGIAVMPFGRAPSRARRIVAAGDTIVSTVRTYLRAVAAIEGDASNLIASTGFAVVTPDTRLIHPRFMYYWLRSTPVVDEICARSVGVSYPATNASEVGATPIGLPPLARQRAIAGFLDGKTAAIDRLIHGFPQALGNGEGTVRQLLDRLRVYRQNLITTAVMGRMPPAGEG